MDFFELGNDENLIRADRLDLRALEKKSRDAYVEARASRMINPSDLAELQNAAASDVSSEDKDATYQSALAAYTPNGKNKLPPSVQNRMSLLS